jgi:FKBP-type peptidyl-prolyl cis-trans isomerase
MPPMQDRPELHRTRRIMARDEADGGKSCAITAAETGFALKAAMSARAGFSNPCISDRRFKPRRRLRFGGWSLGWTLCRPACCRHEFEPHRHILMASSTPSLETIDQRVSYGIALNMGGNITRQGGVEIDTAAFLAGLQDGLSGAKPRLNEQELQAAFQRAQERIDAAAAQGSLKQQQAGDAFLTKNRGRAGVVVTDSGLQYEVLVAGKGAKPREDQTVEVHYHGTLIDGTVFDSSVKRGETISFPVNGVIAGWIEALQLMSVGSKWKLFIPAELGYGNRAQGPIPASSTLIFEVELISIK